MSETKFAACNIIDGCRVVGSAPSSVQVRNPSDGRLIAEIPSASGADIDAAVAAARRAHIPFSRSTPGQRQGMLLRLADAIDQAAEELAVLEVHEAGKPISSARWEMGVIPSSNLRFFAGAARALSAPAGGDYFEAHSSVVRRESVGVVSIILPFNYPTTIGSIKLAAALAGGNTVVLKSPDACPLALTRLVEIVNTIFPPGVVNLVHGGVEVGRTLVQHDQVDMVAFTGSSRAGVQIANAAAPTLKRLQLECGAKSPVVVFKDVLIDRLQSVVATAAFHNAGQNCDAATRLLVERSAVDRVIDALVEHTRRSVVLGDTMASDTTLGPLHTSAHIARITAMIDRRPHSSELVIGGRRADRDGWYFEPTIITNLPDGTELTREEIFGPVITVEAFDDEDEAIARANATRYGLSGSVWTENHARATRVSNGLNCGTVWINDHAVLSPELPWSARRMSGIGSDLGTAALDSYTQLKTVMSYTAGGDGEARFIPST